jgi:hypothetical protein
MARGIGDVYARYASGRDWDGTAPVFRDGLFRQPGQLPPPEPVRIVRAPAPARRSLFRRLLDWVKRLRRP